MIIGAFIFDDEQTTDIYNNNNNNGDRDKTRNGNTGCLQSTLLIFPSGFFVSRESTTTSFSSLTTREFLSVSFLVRRRSFSSSSGVFFFRQRTFLFDFFFPGTFPPGNPFRVCVCVCLIFLFPLHPLSPLLLRSLIFFPLLHRAEFACGNTHKSCSAFENFLVDVVTVFSLIIHKSVRELS